MIINKWDIWLANVPFEEKDKCYISKIRPVLIIDELEVCILVFKMTSHTPRENFIGEYKIFGLVPVETALCKSGQPLYKTLLLRL